MTSVESVGDIAADANRRMLDRMRRSGWAFDFFPAVRLLQRVARAAADIGERGPLSSEPIRFRPMVSVGFPATEVGRIITRTADDGTPRYCVDVTFMGLYGVSTPLPLHYAIDLLRSVDPYVPAEYESGERSRSRERDRADGPSDTNATRDFYDIFHHRLISLLYRAWTKYRYYVTFDEPERDRTTPHLLRMIGLWPDCERAQVGVDPVRMIRYAGALSQHPRSAVTLEGVVSDYLSTEEGEGRFSTGGPTRGRVGSDGGAPGRDARSTEIAPGRDARSTEDAGEGREGYVAAEVEQFSSRWVPVLEEDQNRLGVVNCRLGENLTVGDWVFDLSGAFNLALGPLDWAGYKRFLPGWAGHAEVRALVGLYCQDPLSFTVELRIKPREIPEMRLTSDDEEAARLGLTSWVCTGEIEETSVRFDESSTRWPGGVSPRNGVECVSAA